MTKERGDHDLPTDNAPVHEIHTTLDRLERLSDVLGTGAVQPIAYDARFAHAHAHAQAAAERFAESHPDARPRQVFNSYRGSLGRQVPINGHPVHHWNFPLREHAEEVVSAENLEVTHPRRLPVGDGSPAHQQLHRAWGGKDLQDTRQIYEYKAWGDVKPPLAATLTRWQAFQNPAARVALDDVAERITLARQAKLLPPVDAGVK
jgi:hypothetical protein